MKSRIRQLVSMVCSLALCAALVPAAVFAEAPEDAPAAAPAVTPAVAQIGDTTYPGLQRAVNAAQAGATITLLSDIHETVFIPKDARITLDLNGKTVSTEEAPVLVVEGGSLTVRDSSAEEAPVVSADYKTVTYPSGKLETGRSTVVQVYGGGRFVLESGTIRSTGYCGVYVGAANKGSGTAEIKGGYIHAREYGVGAVNDGSILNITGGVIVADDNAAVAGNGKDGMGGTSVNISGGTVIGHMGRPGYLACGVYHPQSGSLIVTGGTIVADGGVGVLIRGGSADITGGTIIATGTREGRVGDSPVSIGHHGVAVDTRSGYAGMTAEDVVTIGGNASIRSEDPSLSVITDVLGGERNRLVVSGGTFSDNVTEYVIDGSKAVQDEKGNWVLAPDEELAVAVYGGEAYLSLKEALEKAGKGPAAIRLLNSTTESVTIPAGADITLDLAEGAVLTGTGLDHAITNNGTLTITGKGTVKAMAANKAAVENTGVVNLKGGNFTREVAASGPNWYVLDNNAGTMNISDTANVFAEAPNASLIRNVGASADKKATLSISGGTITQKRFIAVKNDDYGVLNITGGTITSDDQAVQNWHAAAITGGTMNGPVISWAYVMPNMDSTLAISGSAVINGDVKSVTYDGKAVPRVTITGGTVNGTLSKGRFGSNAIQALPADSAAAALTVSGGTFKNAVPEAFCAENFHPNKNADGTYSVHTHQFGPWVTTVEPGPSTQGKQVQTCSVCGYEMAKTLPPTGNSGQSQKDPAKPDPAPAKPTPAPAKPTPAPAAKPAPAATPAPAANAPAAAGKAAVTVPQTSDDMPLGLLGGIAAAAAAAVALLILRKRRGV